MVARRQDAERVKVGRGGGSHAVQLALSRTEQHLFETDERMVI